MAALLVAALPLAARAEKGKGAMDLGLSMHYVWPQLDLDELEPALGYGVIFHYWLTSVSTVVVAFEYKSLEGPLDYLGEDKGVTWSTAMLDIGLRYRPELDLWIRPYGEIGLGYQSWATDPGLGFIDPRSGGSLLYFAGLGFEHEFSRLYTAGLNLRYHYMPMNDRLERRVIDLPGGGQDILKTDLEDTGYLSLGVEFTFKIR